VNPFLPGHVASNIGPRPYITLHHSWDTVRAGCDAYLIWLHFLLAKYLQIKIRMAPCRPGLLCLAAIPTLEPFPASKFPVSSGFSVLRVYLRLPKAARPHQPPIPLIVALSGSLIPDPRPAFQKKAKFFQGPCSDPVSTQQRKGAYQ
jgi:hypothetical protein